MDSADKDVQAIIAKIAALEILVENLVVDCLRGSRDPIATGNDFLERVFESSIKHHRPELPTFVAQMVVETIEQVVKRAMAVIQNQQQGKPPQPQP